MWDPSLGNPLFPLELALGPLGDEAPDRVRQLVCTTGEAPLPAA
ncbi:hypothetical protein [Streptomyces sp. NPDC005494]